MLTQLILESLFARLRKPEWYHMILDAHKYIRIPDLGSTAELPVPSRRSRSIHSR